jgi:hypothetical protein
MHGRALYRLWEAPCRQRKPPGAFALKGVCSSIEGSGRLGEDVIASVMIDRLGRRGFYRWYATLTQGGFGGLAARMNFTSKISGKIFAGETDRSRSVRSLASENPGSGTSLN